MAGSRGDYKEVIIEEFVEFYAEITLLTVTKDGHTILLHLLGTGRNGATIWKAGNPAE